MDCDARSGKTVCEALRSAACFLRLPFIFFSNALAVFRLVRRSGRPFMKKLVGAFILPLFAALFVAGCSGDSSSSTTTPTTPAAPTGPVTQVFTSIIYPNDVITHSFTTDDSGPITVTLTNANHVFGLGLGVPNPNAAGCSLLTTLTTGAGSSPQINQPAADKGTYCITLYDIGNAPITGDSFVLSVVYQ